MILKSNFLAKFFIVLFVLTFSTNPLRSAVDTNLLNIGSITAGSISGITFAGFLALNEAEKQLVKQIKKVNLLLEKETCENEIVELEKTLNMLKQRKKTIGEIKEKFLLYAKISGFSCLSNEFFRKILGDQEWSTIINAVATGGAAILSSIVAILGAGYLAKKILPENTFNFGTTFKIIDAADLVDFSTQDVVIPSHVKKTLDLFEFCLKNNEKVESMGVKIPRGFLFFGPPGCGKSLLAKSFAQKLGINYIQANGSDFITGILGGGVHSINNLFELARTKAPCVLFIDEIDAVAKQRTGQTGMAEHENALNKLLSEMDGAQLSKKWDQIIIIGATNFKESLDHAILRPGRLDNHLEMSLPDKKMRKELFRKILKKNNCPVTDTELDNLARESIGMSGAKITATVSEAKIKYVKIHKKIDDFKVNYIFDAIDIAQLGEPDETLFDIPENEKLRVAYHESGHALVSLLTPKAKKLRKITIVPRIGGALGVTYCADDDFSSMDRESIETDIKMLLGGYAAETIYCGSHSAGVSDDLVKATAHAKQMVSKFGMSELGLLVYKEDDSDATKKQIELIANKILETQLAEVIALLQEPKHKKMLDALAHKLLEVKTITIEEVNLLLDLNPSKNAAAFVDPSFA